MSIKGERLQRIGRVWAFVEGKIVVEGEYLPRLGEPVYTSSMKTVGTISSIFGSKNRFFVEVKRDGDVKIREGSLLYVLEGEESIRRKAFGQTRV